MEAAKPAGKRQRTKYDAAFRLEAVRRVSQDGQAATCGAQALGMRETVLGKWGRPAGRPAGLCYPCRLHAQRRREGHEAGRQMLCG